MTHTQADDAQLSRPTLSQAIKVWLQIGLLSFGGPAAQIALMHKMVVKDNRWLSEKQYLNGLSFCMLLPGPEAMQLATYAGWRLHGFVGGLIAGLLFVLPGALVILLLASIYSLYGDVPLVSAIFLGVKAAVLVIVIEALIRVSKKSLNGVTHYAIALLAFIGIFFFALPYPLIVLLAATIGFFGSRGVEAASSIAVPESSRSITLIVLWGLVIWWLPMVALWLAGGPPLLMELGVFFSKLAVVTFGGAYAVLAYMAQDVVESFGWLTAGEMMDGLGLAETTPGPLILVTEFVGFVAGYKEAGLSMAVAAAAITLWVTFVPCFLWIFAGAPYIDWLSAQPRLSGALDAITAAVAGVILNLSLWFALHVLFARVELQQWGLMRLWQPVLASLDWRVLLIASASGVLLLMRHWSVLAVLAVAALAGVFLSGAAGAF
jgi:chromate transporter